MKVQKIVQRVKLYHFASNYGFIHYFYQWSYSLLSDDAFDSQHLGMKKICLIKLSGLVSSRLTLEIIYQSKSILAIKGIG